MRSLLILEIEHDETTDPLDEIVSATSDLEIDDMTILNYTIKVDLPECFVLETE